MPNYGGANISSCFSCTPGMYCDRNGLVNETGFCDAGFVCTGGANIPRPISSLYGGSVCPVASYCPIGSASALSCLAGSYNDLTQQSSCFDCPAGYYCLGNSVHYNFTVCPVGYYCPIGTPTATTYACPVGKFGNVTMLKSILDCLPCPKGRYCDFPALSSPRGYCQEGYYCLGNASTPTPTDGISGNICPYGSYCPLGSSYPLACDVGKFCPFNGMSVPEGFCQAGYYCSGGASRPNSTDGITGDICPPGYYCIAGTIAPALCPIGTFSPSYGTSSITGCISCIGGFYCNRTGLSTPSTFCPPRYVCRNGTSYPSELCSPQV